MSSVLVVVVLLGMWAFVLVPLVRQRNVKADEARSVARFSSALRVLSRGHSLGTSGSGWGHRQWVMPPREGLAIVRQRRLAAAAVRAGTPQRAGSSLRVGPAATRRRQLLIGLAAAVTFTLLLVLVAGRFFIVVQVLADAAFAAGIVACRWSVAQEQSMAARSRRRRDTRELRTSLRSVEGHDEAPMPVMTVPLHNPTRGLVPTMTVPLDAPMTPRRAVPHEAAAVAAPGAPAVPAQHPGLRRPAARHEDAPARPAPLPARQEEAPAAVTRRFPPARPVAEPVVLAEIDLDWEPAVPEPSSLVRLVDLSGRSRRTSIFDESPADGVDVGDDSELDALVQRRLAASGW